MTWVREWEQGDEYAEDLDGIIWYHAPKPRRWHRCTPQTRGFFRPANYIERCACGATRLWRGPWLEKNSR